MSDVLILKFKDAAITMLEDDRERARKQFVEIGEKLQKESRPEQRKHLVVEHTAAVACFTGLCVALEVLKRTRE